MRRPSVKHGHTFLSQITIFVHYLDGWPSHGDSADNIYLIHLKRSLRENIHPIVVWIVVKGYSNSCHMCSYILVTSTFASALFPFWIQFFQFHTLSHAGANICPQNLKLSIGSICLKRLFIHPCSQIYFRSEKVHSASIYVAVCSFSPSSWYAQHGSSVSGRAPHLWHITASPRFQYCAQVERASPPLCEYNLISQIFKSKFLTTCHVKENVLNSSLCIKIKTINTHSNIWENIATGLVSRVSCDPKKEKVWNSEFVQAIIIELCINLWAC